MTAAKLLHMDGLGDRKPSMLMNNMLALMDGHKPCLLFEQVFLEQMLEDIRLLLADDQPSKIGSSCRHTVASKNNKREPLSAS